VWAAKPVTPTPFKPPNRLIWRLSEILAAHKGELVAAGCQDARLRSRLDLDGARRKNEDRLLRRRSRFLGGRVRAKAGEYRRAAARCGEEKDSGPGRAATRL